MAMRKAIVAGAGLAAMLAGAAIAAPAGAPQDVGMQSGAWGPGGWQAGASAPSAAATSAYAGPPMESPTYRPMSPRGDYKPVHPGQKLKGEWRDPGLTVQDWRGWGLGQPGYGMRWIRYYDDAVLVDDRDRVVDVRGGIDWDVAHRRGPYGYEAGGPGAMRGGWHHPPIQSGTTTYRAGPNTTVTTQVIAPPPIVYPGGYAPGYGGGYGAGYGYAGGGSTVIVSPSVVTTTTTTTSETVWHKARARPGCRCARPIRHGKLLRR